MSDAVPADAAPANDLTSTPDDQVGAGAESPAADPEPAAAQPAEPDQEPTAAQPAEPDQEPTAAQPAEPDQAEPGDDGPGGGPPARPGGLVRLGQCLREHRVSALTGAVVALVLLSGALSVLQVLASEERADLRAERARLTAERDEARAQRTELTNQLKAAESRALDPAGYQLIKECVQQYAQAEKLMRATVEQPAAGQGSGDPAEGQSYQIIVPSNSIFPNAAEYGWTCINAESHLK